METQKTLFEEVEIKNSDKVGVVEGFKIDLDKYIGMKSKIASVKTYKGKYGYFVKLESEILDFIPNMQDGESTINIKATKILGLKEENNKFGWVKDGKMHNFLKKMAVTDFSDLLNKKIVVQSRVNSDGREYLTF